MDNPVKAGCLGTAIIASVVMAALAVDNAWFGPVWLLIALPWLVALWWIARANKTRS